MSIGVSLADNSNVDIEPPPPASGEKLPAAILIVEDEPEILAPLSYALKRAGYIVFEAENGLTACRMIGSHQPDLILLDILLPDLDGWEVCRMLRQHPETRIATTPVIMLTALNTPDNKLHGLQLGADAYLPKPYSQQEVLLLSGKLIARHRRQVELEDEVSRLSKTLQQQQDLHHLLFHELRNQLTILHGHAELLEEDCGAKVDASLAAIHLSSDYLQNLAEDFQLIRQVHGDELRLPVEPIFANHVLTEMVELYTPAARARNITLSVRIEGQARSVVTNRPALKIILSALLDNAIKYGPAGQPVVIVCRFHSWRLEFEVHDEGSGVAATEREQVFDRFYRGCSLQNVSGQGLGLYGVRVLTAALGGDAEVDSRPQRGCCFRVWLPLTGTP